MSKNSVISCQDLSKSYQSSASTDHSLHVLNKITLSVNLGEKLALIGKSGSGKSTLLQLLGGLLKPDMGSIIWQVGHSKAIHLEQCSDDEITQARNQFLGFVFQFHHLLPEFDALENVMLPMMIAGKSKSECADQARSLLKQVGLDNRIHHYPAQLSGGEQQRVAICRAVANNPLLLLADEPTGNLDEYHSAEVLDMLQQIQEEMNVSMILATHDRSLEARCDRVLFLSKGHLSEK